MKQRIISLLLAFLLPLSLCPAALADSGEDTAPKGYLVLGEDLTAEEKATVLDFLDITSTEDYNVSYTTNKEEHEAFDSYLGSSVVGSRALSSILMVPGEEGSGISVSSYNITYCTVEMYQNALISAGVEDVAIYIAAPFAVSGTCALLSAMNAYSTITGETIDEDTADAAVDEIVTTGEVADAIGDKDKAAELIALLKQQMVEQDMGEGELSDAIDTACQQMNITISAEVKQQIINLLLKLKNTNIDPDALAEQAGELYSRVSSTMEKLGITKESASGFLSNLLEKLLSFLNSWLDSAGQ